MPRIHDATWKPAWPGKSLEPSMKPGMANISRNVASLPQPASRRSGPCAKHERGDGDRAADEHLAGEHGDAEPRSARRRR